jgi:hypothetical protein
MRKASSLAKTTKWSARALAGKPRDSRNCGDAKKRPQKLARPNFVIATRERLAMTMIKVHSLTGRITSRLMRQAFPAVKRFPEPQHPENSYESITGCNGHQASAAAVADGNLLAVVERFLTSGAMADTGHHPQQAQEAPRWVSHAQESELGLSLSPEKTPMATSGKGYDSLGFHLSSRSPRQRDTSAQKFKAKVRAVTDCHRDLDRMTIVNLNPVIRGTAHTSVAKLGC